MSLLQMSFSGAVMIIAVIIVRFLAINRLPKRPFVLLWKVVLLRLLLPIQIPSILSVYTLVNRSVSIPYLPIAAPVGNVVSQTNPGPAAAGVSPVPTLQDPVSSVSLWTIVWVVGMVICAAYFILAYLHGYMEFEASLPVNCRMAQEWLKEHRILRTVRIRQSGRISAPLTYGILRPVILMPKNTDWDNTQQLQYVLMHEFMHICHYDLVFKMAAALALCVHWFNPMVWVMYLLFNRDTELACDECVVKSFGAGSRSAYATALISMEEKKSGLLSIGNNFSKNAIEERIIAIMKMKKLTIWTLALSVLILVTVVLLFATSPADSTGGRDGQLQNSGNGTIVDAPEDNATTLPTGAADTEGTDPSSDGQGNVETEPSDVSAAPDDVAFVATPEEAYDLFYERTYGDIDYEQIEERMIAGNSYYHASSYYSVVTDYWENGRGVTDVSNTLLPLYYTDMLYYTEEDFKNDPPEIIHLAKNEIYARHGYIFEDEDLNNYFLGCVWYQPTVGSGDFSEEVFNDCERQNLELLNGLDQ